MFDENQLVMVRWNNTNKEWYELMGYKYTKRYDPFYVKAKHLSLHSSAQIVVVCDYCGNEYKTQYALITNGRLLLNKDACSKCAPTKANELRWARMSRKKMGEARRICDECGYELISSEDDYAGATAAIQFRCPIHGIQTMNLDNLLRGHRCRDCGYDSVRVALKHSGDYVKQEIEKVNGNILLNPEDYKGAFINNLRIRCRCGNVFTTAFSSYTKAGINRCHTCSCKESSGELKIREFLESKNITFVQEKRFKDCCDKKPLPFDFYLPDYNTIIEFDGQHHYMPVHGEDRYLVTIAHDQIKNRYCCAHDIHLLRIPYWEGKRMEEIIANDLKIAI
ncbi:MAG: hypothetical protein LUD69_07970 [Oscillospiraceae bacterium]|nr:hypothetical protein [Oscillospiraceae bacterium]